ncbi:MAG: prepilin-type N-terminal cleavage/methylation domain-containing protein [Planctomycetes bacterium]|nr:prepilin-type N-terminal cleavage/methylation domain-containing protein [Planctomycetota bacterium]
MIESRLRRGFTLTELMIVVAIIAAISAMAVPKFMRARLSANEAAAISTLRLLSGVQAQVRSLGAIDTDADGSGEYAYFGELAGTAPMRIATGAGPGAGTAGVDELDPSVITNAFGTLDANGYASRSGYYFQMWLPGPTAGVVAGLPEAAGAGAGGAGGGAPGPGGFPDPDNAEILWGCYAWPVRAGDTGNRVFFVSSEGLVLQYENRTATPFSGTANPPDFGEAYTDPADMASRMRIGVAGGNQSSIWTPVQ